MNIDPKYKMYSIYSLYIGIAVFLIGSTVAILTYPNYSMSGNYFSDAGLRIDTVSEDRGLVEAHPYPEIFNVTLYILSIFLLPFTILISSFFTKSEDSKYLFRLATIPGIFISIGLVGVGIWDWGNDLDTHGDAARLAMGSIGALFILWTLGVMTLPSDSAYKQFKSWKLDPFVTFLIIFFTYTQVWGIPKIPLIEDVPSQVYQKLVPYTTIPYLSFVGYRLMKILNNTSNENLTKN